MSSSASYPARLLPGSSMTTQLMHLDAGKSVSWVVWFKTPTASPRLTLTWESKEGSNLTGLSVDAYHLADNEDRASPPVAMELCWTKVGSGVTWGPQRFDHSCPVHHCCRCSCSGTETRGSRVSPPKRGPSGFWLGSACSLLTLHETTGTLEGGFVGTIAAVNKGGDVGGTASRTQGGPPR
jgi:hypothetical protein